MNILFITSKYPPRLGGMQTLSYNLINNFPLADEDTKQVLALTKSHRHLVWWLPLAFLRTLGLLLQRKIDIVHLNDAYLAPIGFMVSKVFKKPVVMNVHGLDIVKPNTWYQMYLRLFAKKLDLYIANSKYTAFVAEKNNLLPTKVIHPFFVKPK